MYVPNMSHLLICVCKKTSLLQCLFLLQQFRQKIMCFLDLWKDRLIILLLVWALMSFSNMLFFLKGCFPALTVYVSVTHSTLMETDDISCSLTSFTMKPDNCQTRSLALSWNHIRLAYISMCSHHIQHDQSYFPCVHIYKITRYCTDKNISNICGFYLLHKYFTISFNLLTCWNS